MRSLSPKTKVVLISGHADEIVRASRSDCGALAVIDKPLALAQLSHFVSSLLGEHGEAALAFPRDTGARTSW